MSENNTNNNRLVNILVDREGERIPVWEFHERDDLGVFVYAMSDKHFERLLATLHESTPILVWVHLEGSRKGIKRGEQRLIEFVEKYPKLDGKIFLITQAGNVDGFNVKQEVFDRISAIRKLRETDPVTIGELRKPTRSKRVKAIHYNKGEHDWSIRELHNRISDETLKHILGELLGAGIDVHLDVLNPGFSGAIVLKAVYRQDMTNPERYRLIKLSRTRDDLWREQNFERLRELDQNRFVAARTQALYDLDGWNGLLFSFSDKETLRDHLGKIIGEHQSITPVIERAVAQFRSGFFEEFQLINGEHTYLAERLSPFYGTSFSFFGQGMEYQNLVLKREKILAVRQVLEKQRRIYRASHVRQPELEKQSDVLSAFLEQMHRGERASFEPDLDKARTPVAFVHGDFHTANILVDESGREFTFIDFDNVPQNPTKHAFLDLAKLSTDLEISVLPDHLVLNDLAFVERWRQYHRAWMREASFPADDEPVLRNIYEAGAWLREKIVQDHSQWLSVTEAKRQFHMVRLHYLLKAIAYDYEEREKILFFILAASDILEYLNETKYMI